MRADTKIRLVAAAVSLTCLGIVGCSSGGSGGSSGTTGTSSQSIPAGPIKIGAITSLSGPEAAYGLSQKAQFEAVVQLANQAGGIDGHKIELILENDGGSAATSLNDARALVASGVSDVLYAGLFPDSTLGYLMKEKKLVVMLQGRPDLNNPAKYPYLFLDYPAFCQYTDSLLAYAKQQGSTHPGILIDDSPYAASLAACAKAGDVSGLTLVGPVEYTSTAVDVTSQLRQLRSEGADSLVVFSQVGINYVWSGLRSIGWAPSIYTTPAAYFFSSNIGSLASKTVTNCSWPLKQGQSLDSGLTTLFKAVSAKIPTSTSTPIAVYYNDSLGLFKLAVEKTHSLNPDVLRAALQKFQNVSYTSPIWKYTFSATNHDGFPNTGLGICPLTSLGAYDYPVSVP